MPTATVEKPAVFAFDNTYARQLDGFYQSLTPVQVAQPRMLRLNDALAAAYWELHFSEASFPCGVRPRRR